MIKSLKGMVILFLLFLSFGFHAQAQLQVERLKQEFSSGLPARLREKIYAHTDKDSYLSGETIWFRIYKLNTASDSLRGISKIVYVEVLNDAGKAVMQGKIEMNGNEGDGSFLVTSSIVSGMYSFRAYTNWMKNFSTDYYFRKPLRLINVLKKPDWNLLEQDSSITVHLFPEGGNLVSGLKSKIGFSITDRFGKGVDGRGLIISDKGDTVAGFQSLKFGIGSFTMVPQSGLHYRVLLEQAGKLINTGPFPEIYNKGMSLSVSDLDNENISVVVRSAGNDDVLLVLIAHNDNKISLARLSEIRNGEARFIIEKSSLNDGINYFTLFNSLMQPVCERLYFIRPSKNSKLGIDINGDEFGKRAAVPVQLHVHDEQNSGSVSSLSVSVFLTDSLQFPSGQDIYNYFWLGSGLNGTIDSPGYYLSGTGAINNEALDNLMLTKGWRRFKWNEPEENRSKEFSFLPEYEGFIITGRVVNKSSGQPVKGITAYLSIPGEHFHISNSVSGQEGQVSFVIKQVYANNAMIIQTVDTNYRVDVNSSFSDQLSKEPLPKFILEEKWKGLLGFHVTSLQVQNAFSEKNIHFAPVQLDTLPFYGLPDKRYFLDDYTRFPTMEEVMREYVADVRLRKEGNNYHYEVYNLPYQSRFSKEPLVLLDGIPVFNTAKMIAFDPLKVKKIEVVSRKYFLGNIVNEGIISYTTYLGDLGNFELDPNAIVLEYQGLQLKREFYIPPYEKESERLFRIPDPRNVLYWAPVINTGADGEKALTFYTSDIPGKYAIVIQGLTSAGSPLSSVKYISVKK